MNGLNRILLKSSFFDGITLLTEEKDFFFFLHDFILHFTECAC